MNTIPLYVGLDYHQDAVQVCVVDQQARVLLNRRCGNDWREIAGMVEPLNGSVARAGIECCTGAADLAEELLTHARWPMDLAHPGYVARMKQTPDKSDFTDARLLADLERTGYVPRVWLAPREVRELRMVLRFRQQLVDRRRDTKLRIGALLRQQRISGVGTRWSKQWLTWLSATTELSDAARWVIDQHLADLADLSTRIASAERQLQRMTNDDPQVKKLLAIKGIGSVTAWWLRAEVGRFDRFRTGKQLARFCGLSPCNRSTGKKVADSGLVWAGHPQFKAALIEAAHRLARYHPRWRELYTRLCAAGKPKCVALAAVANRWVRSLLHEMR
ncbi:MAG: transposase [Humisphaera sp.]|nr:transposase [Humisphaera sp.]